jgi:SAM-dependent methyltransferase
MLFAKKTFEKYRSQNVVHRALVGTFVRQARELSGMTRPRLILEVGCGTGDLAPRLWGSKANGPPSNLSYYGLDIDPKQVSLAQVRYSGWRFLQGTIYALPFADRQFDLVLACEIFEHLEAPLAALEEVRRVCREFLLLSVPWEPWWRIFNVLRGAYLSAWGNTPGHLQHFSRAGIRDLVARQFEVVAERHPLPWTMLLARRKGT